MQQASAKLIPSSVPANPQRRRRARPPLVLLSLLLLGLGTAGVIQTLAARQHLLRGSADAAAAAGLLHNPLALTAVTQRSVLRAHLESARSEFARARQALAPWNPALSHLGWVPGVGSQLAAAGPAADLSYRTVDAAVLMMDGLTPTLHVLNSRSAGGARLPRLAAALAAGQGQLEQAHGDLTAAAADLKQLRGGLGSARIDAELRRLRANLPRLTTASAWLALAPDLLGAHRPQHYLFVWQNPAELRATGGFMGASDLLTVDHGHISHRFYGHQLPHDITWPPMPLPEEMYTPESNWLFVDSNWSPDFPLSARFERWFYGQDTGSWADGVIDFVDTATPDLLRATGPVYLPRYRLHVDAGNVTALAAHFVNGHYNGPDNSGFGDAVRKQFFYAVLKALLARAERLPVDRLPAVATAFQDMIRRRELMAYHRRPGVEAAIGDAGADGRLAPGTGDYLFIVDDNRSYNKLNPYVHETASLKITVQPSLWLDETLTIRYHVAPSPANLEGGGPNWGLWGTKHDYQDFLRVYAPLGSRLQSMTGLDVWAPRIAYGATQLAGRLLVRDGQNATVVIRYRVPANVFTADGWRSYRLRVQNQPGADLTRLSLALRPGAGVTLQGETRSRHVTVPLDGRTDLSVAVGGSLTPRPELLPRGPAVPDPYIPFQYLRDPRHPL